MAPAFSAHGSCLFGAIDWSLVCRAVVGSSGTGRSALQATADAIEAGGHYYISAFLSPTFAIAL